MKQLRLIDKVGKRDDGQNRQRNNRQQRVIGDTTRQEQTLICAKSLGPERKGARVLEYQRSLGSEDVASTSPRSMPNKFAACLFEHQLERRCVLVKHRDFN